jgi:hypothetical protein
MEIRFGEKRILRPWRPGGGTPGRCGGTGRCQCGECASLGEGSRNRGGSQVGEPRLRRVRGSAGHRGGQSSRVAGALPRASPSRSHWRLSSTSPPWRARVAAQSGRARSDWPGRLSPW